MNINDFISNIKNRISDFKKRSINEAQTKDYLIRPFFQALHWDFSNPDQVVPEDDDSVGKRPDYGFYFNSKKPKFYVEAKSINTNIYDKKIIAEKMSYCHSANVPFLIITNGIDYTIYYTGLNGTNEDKLLGKFSLNDEIDYEIINKLYRESFENDTLENYARNLAVSTNVKKAIENLFQAPTKEILDIINNEIRNILRHGFGDDDIRNVLKHFSIKISNNISTPSQLSNWRGHSVNFAQFEPTPVTITNNSTDKVSHIVENPIVEKNKQNTHDDSNWTIKRLFKNGRWENSLELYNKLKQYLESNGFTFTEKPTKVYIGMIYNRKNYVQIQGQSSGLKIFINIAFEKLSEQEKSKSRDVSNTGHLGMGNTEYFVKNENDFHYLLGIIKKAIENTH